MTECRVNSLPEFIQRICELNSKNGHNTPIEVDRILFRGQSNCDYELIPAIGRGRRSAGDVSLLNEERNLIELAKYKLPDVFRSDLLPIELLALLQHHGIPTRLLDVSESALVALYFACCSNENTDGEVIAFKYNEMDVVNYPIINAIADSYRFARASILNLDLFYQDVVRQPYFLEQNKSVVSREDLEKGALWIERCCEEPLFVFASNRSMRQQVQHGRFILFPNHICKDIPDYTYFENLIEPIPKNSECIADRILIPKGIKRQLLQELTLLGIDHASLFCDSVDAICAGIVDYCKQRIQPSKHEIVWNNGAITPI